MRSPQNTGRIIGLLVLGHLITGLMAPYIMLRPLGEPLSFNATDPGKAFQVRLSVMLLFVGGAIAMAIAFTAWPVFRQYGYALALWVLALAIVNFSLQCAENAAWMSLFTLSQDYAKASVGELGFYNLITPTVRSYWKWVHFTHLLVVVVWMFLLFVVLWRSALVPRILAGLGLLTTLMQITGITLPQFIPYPKPPMIVMGLPLGCAYLALSVWLIAKGFKDPQKVATG
jgi:hypothetical protein